MSGRTGCKSMLVGGILLLGCFGCLFGGTSADQNGNDDFSSAELLTPGTYSGTVSRPSDMKDVYNITLEFGKYLIVNFTAKQNFEVKISFYHMINFEHTLIASSGSLKNNDVSWEQRLARLNGYLDPNFWMVIECTTGTTPYSLRIEKYDLPGYPESQDPIETDKTYSRVFTPLTMHGGAGFVVKNPDLINATVTVDDTPNATPVEVELHDGSHWQDRDVVTSMTVRPGQTGTIEHCTAAGSTGYYALNMESTNCNYSYIVTLTPQNDSGSGRDAPDLVNDTLDDTVALEGSGLYNGSARDDDSTDWYSFNVSNGQTIEYAVLASEKDIGKIMLQLYNADKALVASTAPAGPGITETGKRITNNLIAGKWYINISGDNLYSLDLKLVDQLDGHSRGDAGDTMGSAKTVIPRFPCSGLLGDNDTSDFYTFRALADRNYKIDVAVTSDVGIVNATLYDSTGNIATRATDIYNGAPATLEYSPTADGDLVLGIASKGATYDFQIGAPPGTVPAVTVTSPANGSVLPEATFDLAGTASDTDGLLRIEVSLSGIDWTIAEGTSDWTFSGLSVGEGISTVWVRAIDVLGNTNVTWVVLLYAPGGAMDAQGPRLNITSPADGDMLRAARLDVTGTATDDVAVFKVELSLSGIVWWPVDGTEEWAYRGLSVAEGITTIYVKATDFSGKTDLKSIQVGYAQGGQDDTTEPLISVTSPVNGSMLPAGTFDVSGTASDDFAVVKVEVSQNGIAWLPATGTVNWTYSGLTVGEGISSVWARATDFSGNFRITWISVGFRAGGGGDGQKPSVAITSPGNGTLVSAKTFDLVGTATDDFTVVKVELSLNGMAWLAANGTSSWTFAGLTIGDGISAIWARATDFSGNMNVSWILVGYRAGGTADTKKPAVAITAPINGSVVPSNTVNVTGTTSDDFGVFKVELSLSGIDWWLAGGTSTWTYSRLTLGEGGNTVYVRATDFSGNANTTSILVTYILGGDKDKPVITLTSLKDKAKVSKAKIALLSGTASDNVAIKKLTVKVNDAEVAVTISNGVWTVANVSLQEGKNTIVITATDSSGNAQTATYTITYEKAKSQPGFELLAVIAAALIGLLGIRRRRK